MTDYFIGKDKYVHVLTERTGRGEPFISTRASESDVDENLYIMTFLSHVGFKLDTIEKAREVCPYTVEVAQGQYKVLYKNEDVEVDEDVFFKSLREVGRAQKEWTKPK